MPPSMNPAAGGDGAAARAKTFKPEFKRKPSRKGTNVSFNLMAEAFQDSHSKHGRRKYSVPLNSPSKDRDHRV